MRGEMEIFKVGMGWDTDDTDGGMYTDFLRGDGVFG